MKTFGLESIISPALIGSVLVSGAGWFGVTVYNMSSQAMERSLVNATKIEAIHEDVKSIKQDLKTLVEKSSK